MLAYELKHAHTFNELTLVYLAFDTAGAVGMASGGTSGGQASFVCACVILHMCAPHV